MTDSGIMRRAPPVWLLILLAAALWGGEFIRRGLWEPDEARYAYVAREMREGGHWFAPHIHGEPYPDKPPLMFWAINASSLLTGGHINGISARIPSLIGSLMTLWVVTRLLARWSGVAAAWRGAFVLLTSYLFWHQGGWAQIDALFCGLMMMSVYFLFTNREDAGNRRIVMAYIFAGLAVLAKGPLGLILPLGIYAAGAWATGDARDLKRSHWLWGALLAAAIPAVWWILAFMEGAPKEYFTTMLGEKFLQRAVASAGHAHPFYFFFWHFPVEFMPWTIFAPAAWMTLSDTRLRRRLAAWMLFVIVFFSLFVCKRIEYILPAYPAAAMLVAGGWNGLARLRRKTTMALGMAAICLILIIGIGETIAIFLPRIPLANRLPLIPCALIMTFGGVAALFVFRRERFSNRWFYVFAGILFAHQTAVSTLVYPSFNDLKSPLEFARAVKPCLPPGQPLYIYRHQLAILPLYAERQGRALPTLKEVKEVMDRNEHGVIVFMREDWEMLRPELEPLVTAHEFRMGNKRLTWVEF